MIPLRKCTRRSVSWFASRGWTPQPFQLEVWESMARGEDGLLQAPTGSGKTYAAMGHVLSAAKASGVPRGKGRLRLLWIAPLRALSSDIAEAARAMVDGLGLDWDVGRRTGDTSAKDKARQKKTLPEVLITTPESVHILMAQKGGSGRLADVDAIVVDEWHELIGSKRGVQMELAISWIKQLQRNAGRPEAMVWGISATLAQPREALRALIGHDRGHIVRADIVKEIHIESTMPGAFEKLPWAGHIGLQLIDGVVDVVERHKSTLIFTNTRRQAEVWYQALLAAKPDWAGLLAMHHGSIAKELREWVEDALHDGRLRAVVCTASLDLGVDFHPVDAVVQIGGPKGVSRMIQRAGRSGHRPGADSKVHFVPTHGLELVEAAALRKAIQHGDIEPKVPLMLCWDVLVQWLCTLAVGDGFHEADARASVLATHAYAEMERDDWRQAMDLITTGGAALRAYTEHQRVTQDEDGRWVMRDRTKARRHRMSMGAIVSATMVSVQLKGVGLLGHVEETFIASLEEGDSFVFAGQTVALTSFKGLVAKVRKSKSSTGRTPAWMGGRMSLSSELSHRLRLAWDQMARDQAELEPELQRLMPMVHIQAERSLIPRAHQVLVETLLTTMATTCSCTPSRGAKSTKPWPRCWPTASACFPPNLQLGLQRRRLRALVRPAHPLGRRGRQQLALAVSPHGRPQRRLQRLRTRPPQIPRRRDHRRPRLPGLSRRPNQGTPLVDLHQPSSSGLSRPRPRQPPVAPSPGRDAGGPTRVWSPLAMAASLARKGPRALRIGQAFAIGVSVVCRPPEGAFDLGDAGRSAQANGLGMTYFCPPCKH